MRLKIVVWCSWHRNLSYSLSQSASKSVDKYNEQCLPQANSLRTQPAFSSEHQGPASLVNFIFHLPFHLGLSLLVLTSTVSEAWKEEAPLPQEVWALAGSPSFLSSPSIQR